MVMKTYTASAYIEISKQILNNILEENLAVDSLLPSVRKLAENFEVSKSTIELAFKELIKEDYCYPVHGKGIYLKRIPQNMGKTCSTFALVLGYQKLREEINPFYRNLFLSAESEITQDSDNLLCLNHWNRKDVFAKKEELKQFSSNLDGMLGIGLYNERDCMRLRDTGIPTVIVDVDTVTLGVDCVVFDSIDMMNKLMNAVLAEKPDKVYYLEIKRSSEYDLSAIEKKDVYRKKMKTFKKYKEDTDYIAIDKKEDYKKDFASFLHSIKQLKEKVTIVCEDDFVANEAMMYFVNNNVYPGKYFKLAYCGPKIPLDKLENIPAIISTLDAIELSKVGVEMLRARIKKGPGRAVIKKLKGEIINWDPKK